MRDVDSWIEGKLAKGMSRQKIKQLLKKKGYSADIMASVDAAQTPYDKTLVSKFTRRRVKDFLAFIIVIIALTSGALFTYLTFHTPTAEETLFNLSGVYTDITVMQVVGNSMEPTFTDGQVVFVSPGYYATANVSANEVIALHFSVSNTSAIKRVEAAPLDSVDAGADYLQGTLLLKQLKHYDYVVPPNTMIVLGDNAEGSLDSRNYGIVSIKNLQGKVVK